VNYIYKLCGTKLTCLEVRRNNSAGFKTLARSCDLAKQENRLIPI